MAKRVRSQYTLEFKQEAVRLVQSGQRVAAMTKHIGDITTVAPLRTCMKGRLLFKIVGPFLASRMTTPPNRPSWRSQTTSIGCRDCVRSLDNISATENAKRPISM